jgi:hypothetical protein
MSRLGLLPGAKPAPFPGFTPPCLATPRTKVPGTRRFVLELKTATAYRPTSAKTP